jgi:hypothetical protein
MIKNMIANIMEIDTDCKVTEKFSEQDQLNYAELLIKIGRSQNSNPTNMILSYVNIKQAPLYQRIQCLLDVNWSKKNIPRFLVTIFSILMLLVSFSIIAEPYYGYRKGEIPYSYEMNQGNNYLIEKDGYYELYQNNTYIGNVTTLNEPFNDYKIYKKKGNIK